MNLVVFPEPEGARVWADWNHSFDMNLSCLEPAYWPLRLHRPRWWHFCPQSACVKSEIPLGERQPWSIKLWPRFHTHRPRGRLILPGAAVCDITAALAMTYRFPGSHPEVLPPAHPATADLGPTLPCVTIRGQPWCCHLLCCFEKAPRPLWTSSPPSPVTRSCSSRFPEFRRSSWVPDDFCTVAL